MACVYRAQEIGTPHAYALKFLKAQFHNQPYLIQFFEQEASNMRDLAHPNIVRFYRFVNNDAYSYIIMDYIEGYALSDIIKRMYEQQRHIPLDEVVRVMTQVARALDAIHRDGFVHRDIKPSNVLIQKSDGKTFLSDLGITTETNIEMMGAGTLAYMAPEQSSRGIADHRSDIYAYGIMFFEMLAKQRPFKAESGLRGTAAEQSLIQRHREANVPDITQIRPELPAELRSIMNKALAKSPEDRYDDILSFARAVHTVLRPMLSADLQDFASITHIATPRPNPVLSRSDAEPVQRQRNQAGLLVLVAFIMLLVLGVLLINNNGAINSESTPQTLVAAVAEGEQTASAEALLSAEQTDEAAVEDLSSTTPSPTATETATITPSPTPTTTATFTPTVTPSVTPNPIEGQPVFPFLSDTAALSAMDGPPDLSIAPPPDVPLRFLRLGPVDGFHVDLDIVDRQNLTRYGVAFRVQDIENYLLFSVEAETGVWLMEEVVSGFPRVLQRGNAAQASSLSITGREAFFQIDWGEIRLELSNARWPLGSLALWVEGEPGADLLLESLSVSLIGDEAVAAAATTPTPGPGLDDPYRFLRNDVLALQSTNQVVNSAVDCPVYISIYDTLIRHQNNSVEAVRLLAEDVTRAGALIYTRCQAESPDAPLTFVSGIRDYLDWEAELALIAENLQESS